MCFRKNFAAHVVPTLVGVNRLRPNHDHPHRRCPHAGGGEPGRAYRCDRRHLRCPHAGGGEPLGNGAKVTTSIVVPTLVGVNRGNYSRNQWAKQLSPRWWG